MDVGPSIQYFERVSITNNLTGLALIAHCHSKDDDLGAHVVSVGSDLSWSFEDEEFGRTLFWCDIAVQDKRIRFDAYKDNGMFPARTSWVVDDVGVHLAGGRFKYWWK
ncbi:S-protein homolog 2 [Linum perenne]